MVDVSRSMLDPQLNQQFKTVFERFDKEERGELTFGQFEEFCYAIGLQFLIVDYLDDIKEILFEGNAKSSRVSYESFKEFIDLKSRFEEGQEQYEKDMQIFDEDGNGTAPIKDVMRVMKELVHMEDDEIALFIKKSCIANLTEEDIKAPLDLSKLPESFKIAESTSRLYNV